MSSWSFFFWRKGIINGDIYRGFCAVPPVSRKASMWGRKTTRVKILAWQREQKKERKRKRERKRTEEDGAWRLHRKRKATHIYYRYNILVSISLYNRGILCACPFSARLDNRVQLTRALVRSLKFSRVGREHDESEYSIGFKADDYRIVQDCWPNRTNAISLKSDKRKSSNQRKSKITVGELTFTTREVTYF